MPRRSEIQQENIQNKFKASRLRAEAFTGTDGLSMSNSLQTSKLYMKSKDMN